MERLINLLKSQQVTLFLGAGSSFNLGGPSGDELLQRVKKEFSGLELPNENNFFDVCKEISDSDIYDRSELQDHIIKQLNGLYPNDDVKYLISLPWKCIFTTNYDLVVERVPSNLLNGRHIRAIKENNPRIELSRYDTLYYIKMLGSIDSTYGEEGYPVLTRTEYNTSFLRRASYYNILSDCVRRGPIIFLGYSFKDNLVFDIMDELQQSHGPDIIRSSYAISPEQPTGNIERLFKRFHISHVQGTLETFVQFARNALSSIKYERRYSDKTVHIRGYPIDIPISLERSTMEHFQFLNSNSFAGENCKIKDFFSGEASTYYPYQQGWDYLRQIYVFNGKNNPNLCNQYGKNIRTGLKDHIFQNINDPSPEKNQITILTGPAGSGKTTIINRLAFDWYTAGYPVILVKPHSLNFDYLMLDTFIEHLDNALSLKNEATRPRTLIICDHCAPFIQDYEYMFDFLTSRGRLVSLLLVDRENKIKKSVKSSHLTYSIPESLSQDELESFVEYLKSHNIIESDIELYGLIDNPDVNNSLFALMYTIIDEAKRPLNKIIHDQYMQLSAWPRRVYEFVCLFNYYNENINEDLLIRSTIDSWSSFYKEIDDGELSKVIFPDYSVWESTDYRVHHPIIAQKTIELELPDPSLKVQRLLELFQHLNPNIDHEVKKVENFLIKKIGPNSHEKEIPLRLKKDIFEFVSSKLDTRSIYHHYALLEMTGQQKDYVHAEELLRKSLKCQKGHEPDANIYTSFGKLYSYKGYSLEDEGKIDEAERCYETAKRYYKAGRKQFFKNKKSYHGEVVLHMKQGFKASDEIEKINHFSKAIDLCEEAINTLDEIDHTRFLEEEAKISKHLNNIENFETIIDILAVKYHNASGYRLKSYILYKKLQKTSNEREKLQLLTEISNAIKKGLNIEFDSGLLRLEAKIQIEFYSNGDVEHKYDALKRWYDFSDHSDLDLLFQYGMTLFEKGLYKRSREIFKELESISIGRRTRSLISRACFIMADEQMKEYRGKVTYYDSAKKIGYLKCTSLPNLDYDIRFIPKYQPQVGDYVTFNIGFNMRGAIGMYVTKD